MSQSTAKAKRRQPPQGDDLKKPSIKLMADYLLIQMDSPKVMELTLQGQGSKVVTIARPNNSRATAYMTGTVVAAGPGLINVHLSDNRGKHPERVPMDCKVGDRVLFGSNLFVPFLLRGEEFVLLRDQNIIGIL